MGINEFSIKIIKIIIKKRKDTLNIKLKPQVGHSTKSFKWLIHSEMKQVFINRPLNHWFTRFIHKCVFIQ